ncbi:uncharacterized protein LOC129765043 isoform X2 [Toxorhynchites rutilus septentrionalis]|uniref:uncharacterized protein LOC129765043 isoform X2 n=1 Tax=Toxorhynchites rutilus septentrionalis TaxID=329112 RepID=UPI002479B6F7|nr:uncharacterized protein LOC129765043 isoform X2 [Toxorhynchites rutilus septentrionalis]
MYCICNSLRIIELQHKELLKSCHEEYVIREYAGYNSIAMITERTSTILMEAPKPPGTVEHLNFITCADFNNHRSRSVPVFGVGEGVFQCVNSGKYECNIASSLPEFRPISRDSVYHQANSAQLTNLIGMFIESEPIVESTMGTPSLLDTVVFLDVSAVGVVSVLLFDVRKGGSQSPVQGKYRKNTDLHPADEPSPSSIRQCKNIHAYYQNVRGINTCISDYLLACSDYFDIYDIIALTETWLDNRTLSNQVCGQNYEVFRTDRNQFNSNKSSGGGVLIAVHPRLKAQLIVENAWSCVEQDVPLYVPHHPPPRQLRNSQIVAVLAHRSSVLSTM